VDKRFVGQFNDLVFMREPDIKIPKEYANEISGNLMRCNGCGAKVAADPLKRVLERLDVLETKSVELGVGDDSARIVTASGKMLLTIDGFRSLVSDPYLFGRITAHHSLNDIFAMGATPTVALCLATIPYMAEKLMEEELYQLLSGVNDVLKEHNVALVGGHSAEGIETSLGLMVTGLESGRSRQKNHARAGEVLILTKPLGTGVILASASIGKASARSVSKCFDQMNQSNYEAMKLLLSENVSALTDITGYGLIGHLVEVLKASHCGATLDLTAIPTLVDAESLMSIGHVSSLQQSNEAALRDFDLGKGLTFSMPKVRLLVDPQTAGGLLASVPQENESSCLSKLSELGYQSASIGRIEEKVWAIR
jgi:selenide,water dikinase